MPRIDSSHCLVCNGQLYDALQRSLPMTNRKFDALTRKLSITGHSFRRTLALFLRIRAEQETLQIGDFFFRINKLFKWSRYSKQSLGYSKDYQGWTEWKFPEFLEAIYQNIKNLTEESLKRNLEKLQDKCNKYVDEERRERAKQATAQKKLNRFRASVGRLGRKILD